MFLRVPGWLTLQEASERLDVHPATLRQWADRGRIRMFRTPGGHRRFSADDVQVLVSTLSTELTPDLDLLLSAVLGRVRREVAAGRLAGERWYRMLDASGRERFRQLGGELIGLLVRSLLPGADAGALLGDVREVAREQGRLAALASLTTAEAVRAHSLFRDALVESVLQLRAVRDQGRLTGDLLGHYRRLGSLVDDVLVAYLDAFSETGGRP
jgi:excisionase family DNA binding protein